MKGLLLKDFYMVWKYCRMIFAMTIVFLAVSATGQENIFFVIYPMMAASIIPSTLLSYDEKSGRNVFSQALPYSRIALVSVKYLIAAALVAVVWILSAAIQLIRFIAGVGSSPAELAIMLSVLLCMGLVSSGLILPVMFKHGVDTGRFAYYVTIAAACGGGVAFPQILENMNLTINVNARLLPAVIVCTGIIFFAISWLTAIKFYQKRED